MINKNLILDLQYLPCIVYIEQFLHYENIILDVHENYEKQSYRNRCRIQLSNKTETLSIPVVKGNSKQKMKDVLIDNSQQWQKNHWRSIVSGYGNAAFFEYYADFFEKIFSKRYNFLIDFNLDLLTICLQYTQVPNELLFSEEYIDISTLNSDTVDLRSLIHPKKEYEGISQNGINTYQQVFGKGFVKNLSVIDLIFCEGTNSINILKRKEKM